MVKTSSPGKLMLFGDHSVVHGRPCIVTAVDYRMNASLSERRDDIIVLNAPDMNIENYVSSIKDLEKPQPKQARFVLTSVRNFFDKYGIRSGLDIETKSEFRVEYGLGSSSAVTASVLKGLSELFDVRMSNKDLFDLSYKTILDIQEVGSGFDAAATIYGGSLYFVTGGRVIEPIKAKELPIIVGHTGVKADTSKMVKMVYQRLAEEPERINRNFDESAKIVDRARRGIEEGNWKEVGMLMDQNQVLLREIGVSSDVLENLITAAKKAGAYGAKLAGAGGGDCMISIADKKNYENVKNAIEDAGGKFIDVKLNADGVRIEK